MERKLTRKEFLQSSAAALLGLPLLQGRGANALAQQLDVNPIVLENAKPGSFDWYPNNPARHQEIEGYASSTSVNRGNSILFYVNTSESYYQIEIFRLGWYGGAGARRMTDPVKVRGTRQTRPRPNANTGLIECCWNKPVTLRVPCSSDPTNWCSGVYIAKLTALTSQTESYIPFVVRDDARSAAHLFQLSVTTYQAYNAWGGKSLYEFNSTNGRAVKVSFNRPYDDGYGTGNLLAEWSGWECNMLRFLEREGYDLNYCTNLETHTSPALIARHRSFLSVGHDEYWSWQMRQNVEDARNKQAMHLGFFTANACYWQVRFERDSLLQGNRTMVCYKDDYQRDPYYPILSRRKYTTVTWRDPILNRPEDSLIGVMYEHNPVNGDIIIENANHWAYENSGLNNGDRLVGLLGYEVDRIFGNAPAPVTRLAHSPYATDTGINYSDMSIYTLPNGANVFATGTIQWAWGLDDLFAGIVHPNLVNPATQQITRNLMNRFARVS